MKSTNKRRDNIIFGVAILLSLVVFAYNSCVSISKETKEALAPIHRDFKKFQNFPDQSEELRYIMNEMQKAAALGFRAGISAHPFGEISLLIEDELKKIFS